MPQTFKVEQIEGAWLVLCEDGTEFCSVPGIDPLSKWRAQTIAGLLSQLEALKAATQAMDAALAAIGKAGRAASE